jgi:hypothetical protein
MNPNTKFIVSIGILIMPIFGCNKDTDLSDCGQLYGNAKLKRVLEFSSIGSSVPLRILEQYEYDELGRISKFSLPMGIDTNIDNRVYYYDLYEYNSVSQLIRKARYNANVYSPSGYYNQSNFIYTYSSDGKVTKEYIEYPLIGSFSYSLYLYSKDKLVKIEKYKMDTDELESYLEYEYDKCGRLAKENIVNMSYTEFIYFTKHSYQNGLNFKSDDYAGRSASNIEHIREMLKTYDTENNLILNEINELQEFSTQPSRVIRYEYYDK